MFSITNLASLATVLVLSQAGVDAAPKLHASSPKWQSNSVATNNHTPDYHSSVDSNSGVGIFDATASSYSDCSFLRSKQTDFCAGLPVFDAKSGRSLHGECLTTFSSGIDKCTQAIDQHNIPFNVHITFDSRSPKQNVMKNSSFGGSRVQSNDLSLSVCLIDANTYKATCDLEAETYADCSEFRASGKDICAPLPAFDPASGLSLHGDCLTYISQLADTCVSCIDKHSGTCSLPVEIDFSAYFPAEIHHENRRFGGPCDKGKRYIGGGRCI